MTIIEAVRPVIGLYFGPAAVAAYRAWGGPASRRWRREHGDPPARRSFAGTAVGVSHCGAGCTLGDIAAEFAVFALAPMRGLGLRKGLIEAAKADIASLTAFEIGLYGAAR